MNFHSTAPSSIAIDSKVGHWRILKSYIGERCAGATAAQLTKSPSQRLKMVPPFRAAAMSGPGQSPSRASACLIGDR